MKIRTALHRKRLSDALKGRSVWNKGIPRTDEVKQKLIIANLGKKASSETRMKMSAAHKGKGCGKDNPMFGVHRFGPSTSQWKGGVRKHCEGYIQLKRRDHPHSNKDGYVLEHRIVVEKQIGRFLLPNEEVHHLGEKDDNRPYLLMAFISHSAHMRFERGGNVKPEELVFDGRKLKGVADENN